MASSQICMVHNIYPSIQVLTTTLFQNNRTESGTFIKGKLFGKGEIKYRNGNIYKGHLKGSKRDGLGHMTYYETENKNYPNDTGVYEGQWRRDQRCGEGKMLFDNNDQFSGIWLQGTLLSFEIFQSFNHLTHML